MRRRKLKLSNEQRRVLLAMHGGVEYSAKDLNTGWPTLAALYEKGLVGEALYGRCWALLTRQHHKRRFTIFGYTVKNINQFTTVTSPKEGV